MRRYALLASLFALPGCTGFGTFLAHTFTLPDANPNIPMTDSETVRRVLGQPPAITPLQPEPGNVWPGPQRPDPTLNDVAGDQNQENRRGFPPTATPGGQPGLPDHRQPRPQGSSTPPGSVQPDVGAGPANPGPLQPPPSSVPGPGPQGRVVQTPRGPAVDTGGTNSYRQLTTPQGTGAIMVPNGNGTSTIINPNGTVETVPTPR